MASKEQRQAADKAYQEGLKRQQAAKADRRAKNLRYLEEKKKLMEARQAQEEAGPGYITKPVRASSLRRECRYLKVKIW